MIDWSICHKVLIMYHYSIETWVGQKKNWNKCFCFRIFIHLFNTARWSGNFTIQLQEQKTKLSLLNEIFIKDNFYIGLFYQNFLLKYLKYFFIKFKIWIFLKEEKYIFFSNNIYLRIFLSGVGLFKPHTFVKNYIRQQLSKTILEETWQYWKHLSPWI